MLTVLVFLMQASGAASSRAPGDVPASQPCRLPDAQGRLIEKPPEFCDKLVEALDQHANRPPSTLVEFEVSKAGKVEQCRVVASSGAPELDAKACSLLLEKARFAATSRKQKKRIRVSWQMTQ